MKNYSISPFVKENWVTIAKDCLELDQSITALQNYIDFSNPNKIVLNYIYNKDEIQFYTNENLIELNIVRTRVPNEGEDIDFYGINLDKLYPGQIIYNNLGNSIILYPTSDTADGNASRNSQGEFINPPYEVLEEGSAVFKILSEQKNYQIIALDSVGAFYIFYNLDLNNNQAVFKLLPNATLDYGLNYLFSFTAENARWFYIGSDAQISGMTFFAPEQWSSEPMVAWGWNTTTDKRIPIIVSSYGTLWSANSTISNEIYQVQNNQFEEVFCSGSHEISSHSVDKGSRSQYTINTDINTAVANTLNFRITLY